ncbi:MAG TPA: DUF2845 domain-containing protein [Candidatus Sulfobium mesophilum]|nr:DUF2845 domain-containing protein [Candidatus Sulfobium mesophilum]
MTAFHAEEADTIRTMFVSLILTAMFVSRSAEAQTLRSDGEFPDLKDEVLAKCGEPMLNEERKEETLVNLATETKKKISIIFEDWAYNFGPDKIILIFLPEDGKLVDIKTGGCGN